MTADSWSRFSVENGMTLSSCKRALYQAGFVVHRAALAVAGVPPSTVVVDHPSVNCAIQLSSCRKDVTVIVFMFEH